MQPPVPEPRYTRRLSDKILVAFHHACDQQDIEVAWEMLNVLGFMAMRMPNFPIGLDRRYRENFIAAHERLWHIRIAAAEGNEGGQGGPLQALGAIPSRRRPLAFG
jgi:hypothetical protein